MVRNYFFSKKNYLSLFSFLFIFLLFNNNVRAGVTNSSETDGGVMMSENFKVNQVYFEESSLNSDLASLSENNLLFIDQVKGNLFIIKDEGEEELNLMISCRSSRNAFAEVEYSKSGEKSIKRIEEGNYGMNHSFIIPNIDYDSVYHYRIKVVDVDRNEALSDSFVIYTGAPNVSLIDVLGNAFREVFGWLLVGKD